MKTLFSSKVKRCEKLYRINDNIAAWARGHSGANKATTGCRLRRMMKFSCHVFPENLFRAACNAMNLQAEFTW